MEKKLLLYCPDLDIKIQTNSSNEESLKCLRLELEHMTDRDWIIIDGSY